MKIVNFAVLNILLLGGLSLSTCNKAHAKARPEAKRINALSTEIRDKVSFPNALLNQTVDEKVVVSFKIKADKKLDVIFVESMNTYLQSYVKDEMEKISIVHYEGFEGKTLEQTLLFTN